MALESLPQLGGVPRAWASPAELARACGYKGYGDNSAPKGIFGSMVHFDLVERGSDKKMRLRPEVVSALADEGARARLISLAIKRPAIHQALLARFGGGTIPARNEVAQHLMDDRGFASRPAQIMSGNFLDDLKLARSVEHRAEALEFMVAFSTPSGARVILASDQALDEADLVYLEQCLSERRQAARVALG